MHDAFKFAEVSLDSMFCRRDSNGSFAIFSLGMRLVVLNSLVGDGLPLLHF